MNQENKAGGNIVANAGVGNTLTATSCSSKSGTSTGGSIDLQKLADDLTKLRTAMQQEATEPEHDLAIGHVSMAAKAGERRRRSQGVGIPTSGREAVNRLRRR